MSHNSNKFDRAIGQLQAMLKIESAPLRRGALDYLPDIRPVFRMRSFNHQFHAGPGGRIAAKDSKGFLGPEDLAAGDIPSKAAGEAQPLRLLQVSFTLAQRLLRPYALGSFPGFPQRAVHRWHKPGYARFQNIIGGADFEGLNGH